MTTPCHLPESDWTVTRTLQALASAELVYEQVLGHLAERLDEQHGTCYGKEGWRYALGAWLLHLVHPVIAYFEEDLIHQTPSPREHAFPDFDFLNYFRQLSSAADTQAQFLTALRILRDNPCKKKFPSSSLRKRLSGKTPQLRAPDPSKINLRAMRLSTRNREALQSSKTFSKIATPWSLESLPVPLVCETNLSWRLQKGEYTMDSTVATCLAMAELTLPAVYLEAFPALRPKARGSSPFSCCTSNAFYSDVAYGFYLAENHATSHSIHHQHGGGYGIDRAHALEQFERRVSKKYFTWGWSGSDHSDTEPLPQPPNLISTEEQPKGSCLLICVSFPTFVYRLHNHPTAKRASSLVKDTLHFLKLVPPAVNLRVRPYPHDYGHGFARRLSTETHHQLEEEETIRQWRMESTCSFSIVVANYLGTAWLETLSANIPTVCFYDPQVYAFREKAAPIISDMLAAGILHESPESAAEHLNRIHQDPDAWWRKSETQDVRERFCSQFALTSVQWVEHWEEHFSDHLHAGN